MNKLCYIRYLGFTRMLNHASEMDLLNGLVKYGWSALSAFLTGAVIGVT